MGFAGDLPNIVNNPAASKLNNEFILVRTRIIVKFHHFAEIVFVIPAKSLPWAKPNGRESSFSLWTPASRFRGDKFTPAQAGAGVT